MGWAIWFSSRAVCLVVRTTHQGSVIAGEALAGEGSEGLDKVQIVVGGADVDMAHVGRKQGQFRLHVNAGAVPTKQGVNREAVPKVMNAWQTTIGLLDVREL